MHSSGPTSSAKLLDASYLHLLERRARSRLPLVVVSLWSSGVRRDQRRSGKRARCIRNEVTKRRCAACEPQLRESATLSKCCALVVQARVRLPRPRQAPLLPRQPEAPQPRRASAAASASAAGGHAPLQGRLWRTHAAAAPTLPMSPQHTPRSDQPYLHPATHPRPPVSQAQPHARPPSGLGKSAPKTGSGTVAQRQPHAPLPAELPAAGMADLERFDPALLGVAQQISATAAPGENPIDTLLDIYFGFLRRKTDFFR